MFYCKNGLDFTLDQGLEKTKAERAEAEKALAALKVKAAKASPEAASPAHKAEQGKTEGMEAARPGTEPGSGGKPVVEGEAVEDEAAEGDAPRADGESPSGDGRRSARNDKPSGDAPEAARGAASGSDDKPSSPDVARLEERISKLYAPVDAIFEKKLKPGLYDLLTKEQKDVLARRESAVKELNKSGEDVRKP